MDMNVNIRKIQTSSMSNTTRPRRSSTSIRYTMGLENDDKDENSPRDDDKFHHHYYQRLESPCPALEQEPQDDFNRHGISGSGTPQAILQDEVADSPASENDEPLDAFFHLAMPLAYFDHEHGQTDDDHETHPRPASASSIASSLVQRASSVLQETSFVVQEVIKHGTICGGTAVTGGTKKNDACSAFHVVPTSQGIQAHTRACSGEDMSGRSDYLDPISPPPVASTTAIPLRYSQSSPGSCSQYQVLGTSFEKPMDMKRSISTPPTFLQSRRGSAFGRVTSNSSLMRENSRRNSSAFDPVESSDGPKSVVSVANKIPEYQEGEVVGCPLEEGSVSCSSTFSAKAQRKIKERRRNRLGKLSNPNKVESVDVNNADDKVKQQDASEIAPVTDESNGKSKGSEVELDDTVDMLSTPRNETLIQKVQSTRPSKMGLAYQLLDGGECEDIPQSSPLMEDEESSLRGEMYGNEESPATSPIPLPAYRKMGETTDKPQPRLVLPNASVGVTFGNRSPCSQESSSLSKSTTKSAQSLNTSNQTPSTLHSGGHASSAGNGYLSSNRSVTSSVAEADREVKETNRRQLRRLKMDEPDCTMSIHSMQSSDTTSTNPYAYLALASNSTQLREGASMPFDRFFARNGVQSTAGSSYHQSVGSTICSSSGSGRPPAMNPKSPANTVSSTSVGHSVSSGEDAQPPRVIKAKFGSGKKVGIAPLSDDLGYSRLGSDSVIGLSSNSSKSSSSKSSSKSHRKDRTNLYQKMRTSTPSPGPSSSSPYSASPVKMPTTPKSPRQFLSNAEHSNLQRPHVRRSVPLYGNHHQPLSHSNKFHLVSPIPDHETSNGTSNQNTSQSAGAFRPMSIYPSVTPERNVEDFLSSRRASV